MSVVTRCRILGQYLVQAAFSENSGVMDFVLISF